jgi:hypothetical protein
MAIKHHDARLLQPGAGSEELCEDIFAAALVFQHLPQAADLALDAGEAVQQFLVFSGIHVV